MKYDTLYDGKMTTIIKMTLINYISSWPVKVDSLWGF